MRDRRRKTPTRCRRPAPAAGALSALWLALALAAPLPAQEEPPAEPSSSLSSSVDAAADRELEEVLRERFERIEGLGEVSVEVEAGVVELGGKVLSEADRTQAVSLARRTEGVAGVTDRIEVELGVERRLTPVLDRLIELASAFLAYLPLLAVALLIAAAFTYLGRLLTRWEAPFRHLDNPFLRDLVRQAIRVGAFLVGLLIALELLDAMALVGAVLGTAGVVGLALGFAFRDLVENYIASLLLSLRQPFAPNDFIDVDGKCGKVIRLTSRATILMTLDGNHLRIPNAQVFKGVIVNYTRNPLRRFNFGVGVGVGEDLVEAQRLGVAVLEGMEGVLRDPAPWSQIEELGDSSVLVRYYGWVDQEKHGFAAVRSEAIRLVKTALEDAGMDLPEPIYRVQMIATDATQPERLERAARSGAVEADLSAGDAIDGEIAAERAASEEADLLDAAAPKE